MSANGETIIFDRSEGDGTRDLYLIDSDGQNERLLFDDTSYQSYDATLSPDREKIVFEKSPSPGGFADLYRIDLDGENLTQLTSSSGWESGPSFSSDGNKIVFSRMDDIYGDNFKLVTINRDGTG